MISEDYHKNITDIDLEFNVQLSTSIYINCSVGRGDSSHFPHIYNSLKTGRAGIVCSSVMVVPHMTFMHSEYP